MLMSILPAPHDTDPDQYLTKVQVAQLCQVDTRTVDRWRADPRSKFPRPAILPGGKARWLRTDITDWLYSRRQTLRRPS